MDGDFSIADVRTEAEVNLLQNDLSRPVAWAATEDSVETSLDAARRSACATPAN